MTCPSDRVQPAPQGQCQFPSERMLNGGGCSYGTEQERRAWRLRHFELRKSQGWATGHRHPDFCARSAKWVVDGGLHLCALHAGAEALEVLMTGRQPPEEQDMSKKTMGETLGIPALFGAGAVLQNLRGHAQRLREEIAETAAEVGGNPRNSQRYLDACEVVRLCDSLDLIGEGRYAHVTQGPVGEGA